jgi:diguanylate cyclase (GGDEF)-like protein
MRGRLLAVVLWDLDHFKQFNDRHGHAAGDDVLRIFSGVLQKHTRHHNLSARYGGEEFISIVTDVNAEGMLIFANKVLNDLRAAPSAWGTITSSAGIAEFRKGMGSYEVLVASADRALYAAKAAGRDRIEVIGELEPRASQPRLSLAMPAHQQRVLVVDDDPNVRRALVEALESEGFAVESTASAHDASQMLYGGPESIDLLVTSLMLPRVSGFTLVDQLQEATPDLRVVYLSENMRENVSWRGVPGTVTRFVSKPVDPKKLVAAAKEALAEEIEEEEGLAS